MRSGPINGVGSPWQHQRAIYQIGPQRRIGIASSRTTTSPAARLFASGCVAITQTEPHSETANPSPHLQRTVTGDTAPIVVGAA
jgi:hypothetical protein